MSTCDTQFPIKETDGLVVVFLHHFGGSSRTWTEVVQRLPNVPCLPLNLRGFGDNAMHRGPFRIADYVSDVRNFVSDLRMTRFVLVGHSMGGKIAMAFAAERPAALESLVLLAPSPPTPEPMTDAQRATLQTALDRDAAGEVVAGATAATLAPEILRRTIADVKRSDPAAWREWLTTGSREDISNFVGRIDVPVNVLGGACDHVMTPAVLSDEVVGHIDVATLCIVPDVAHLLPLEAPASVAAAITSAIQRRSARQTSIQRDRTGYPRHTIDTLIGSPFVTDATRRAIIPRADAEASAKPTFFNAHELATLRAIAARLIPQRLDRPAIETSSIIDERLAHRMSNGWRYDAMPSDGDAYRVAFAALDDDARRAFGRPFVELDGLSQDSLLLAVQRDDACGTAWKGVNATRFFEELLAELSELYFSHPAAQETIGYVGMADAKGWTRIGLNQLEPIEPVPTTEVARA